MDKRSDRLPMVMASLTISVPSVFRAVNGLRCHAHARTHERQPVLTLSFMGRARACARPNSRLPDRSRPPPAPPAKWKRVSSLLLVLLCSSRLQIFARREFFTPCKYSRGANSYTLTTHAIILHFCSAGFFNLLRSPVHWPPACSMAAYLPIRSRSLSLRACFFRMSDHVWERGWTRVGKDRRGWQHDGLHKTKSMGHNRKRSRGPVFTVIYTQSHECHILSTTL